MRGTRHVPATVLAVAVVLASAPTASAKHRTPRRPSSPKATSTGTGKAATAIDLCCAWDKHLSDGLSFSVSAPSQAKSIMSPAIRSWASAVKGLKLAEVSPGRAADVIVTFRAVSGNTQGQTTIRRDRSGLATSAEIYVAGSYKGKPNSAEVLGQIMKHEFGHALGLKHANGTGDLMSTTIQSGAKNISSCDVRAVRTANAWYFEGAKEPRKPAVTKVAC